ncbi:MAG: flagellar motor switch protein FliN [bacterium]|nr:flagellar motor switch protein FliN [bacterium]
MTTEITTPPPEIVELQSPDPKLALNEFSEAMADGDMPATTDPEIQAPAAGVASGLEALYDIPVNITVVLGRTQIEVTDLLALSKGDVVELDRKVGESVDILVNNRLVARGEVVLVEERLGITMTEIIRGNQSG